MDCCAACARVRATRSGEARHTFAVAAAQTLPGLDQPLRKAEMLKLWRDAGFGRGTDASAIRAARAAFRNANLSAAIEHHREQASPSPQEHHREQASPSPQETSSAPKTIIVGPTHPRMKPPNLIACRSKSCEWSEDLVYQVLPMRCPVCGGPATVRCGAGKQNQRGERCARQGVRPGERCRIHGRHSLKGPANPKWVDGRASRYLPARFLQDPARREVVEAAFGDSDLLYGLDRQLAAQLAVEQELLTRLGTGESGAAWEELQRMREQMLRQISDIIALASSEAPVDRERASAATRELFGWLRNTLAPAIRDGAGDEHTRRELREHWESRAKLLRARATGERSIPVQELALFLDAAAAQTAAILQRYLDDDKLLSRVLGDLQMVRLPRMLRR